MYFIIQCTFHVPVFNKTRAITFGGVK